MVLDGFGWFGVVLGGFGWFRVLVTTQFEMQLAVVTKTRNQPKPPKTIQNHQQNRPKSPKTSSLNFRKKVLGLSRKYGEVLVEQFRLRHGLNEKYVERTLR